jgi:hypothetical protein
VYKIDYHAQHSVWQFHTQYECIRSTIMHNIVSDNSTHGKHCKCDAWMRARDSEHNHHISNDWPYSNVLTHTHTHTHIHTHTLITYNPAATFYHTPKRLAITVCTQGWPEPYIYRSSLLNSVLWILMPYLSHKRTHSLMYSNVWLLNTNDLHQTLLPMQQTINT